MLVLLLACTPEADKPGADQPPTAPVLAVTPADPATGDDLVATLVTPSTDPDGDEVTYTWAWKVDGLDRLDLVGDTVPATDTDRGETWSVTVTPSAGGLTGEAGTASATIGNSAPGAVGVVIEPADPRDDDDLTCVVDDRAEDPDGDDVTYTYAWTVGGQDAGITEATVPASATTHGDTWTCIATPTDGDAVGTPGEASASIRGCTALALDGYDDYAVTGPSGVTWGDAFTLEAWFWFDTALYYESYDYVVTHGWSETRAVAIQVDHAVAIDGVSGDEDWVSEPLVADRWHHVALVFADGTATLWVDGELADDDDGYAAPGALASLEPFHLGGLSTWPDDYSFGGWLGAVRASGVARYEAAFTPTWELPPDTDTIAAWAVDEAAGSTLVDGTGNGLDATIHGAAWAEVACPSLTP